MNISEPLTDPNDYADESSKKIKVQTQIIHRKQSDTKIAAQDGSSHGRSRGQSAFNSSNEQLKPSYTKEHFNIIRVEHRSDRR